MHPSGVLDAPGDAESVDGVVEGDADPLPPPPPPPPPPPLVEEE